MSDLSFMKPRAAREGLTAQTVGDEVLIFDDAKETAHALNAPAAFVWQRADGTRTMDQLAREMAHEFGAPVDAHVIGYALEQLHKKELLATPLPVTMQRLTRRQFLARVAVGTALLAVVTSIVAPTPAHAQSGCLGNEVDC